MTDVGFSSEALVLHIHLVIKYPYFEMIFLYINIYNVVLNRCDVLFWLRSQTFGEAVTTLSEFRFLFTVCDKLFSVIKSIVSPFVGVRAA